MREIKFRAFIKPIIENGEIIYTGGMVTPSAIDFRRELIEYIEPIYGFGLSTKEYIRFSEVELLQYTGLNDKDGVEIYESDILKNEFGRMCKVVWHEYQGCWDLTPINSDGHVKKYFSWDDWEIIGNIYENPELQRR